MADKIVSYASPPDGVIRFNVDNVSTLDFVGKYSQEIEVRGLLWMANVYKSKPKDETNCLFVTLGCFTNQSTKWSIDVDVEYILVHPDNKEHITERVSDTINNKEYNAGGDLTTWKKFTENKKGLIKDDKIAVEIRFWITNMSKIESIPQVDFTDPHEPRHDIALLLSLHSPVLNAMFYGEFAESKKSEIELKEIDRKEFIGVLKVIYPPYAMISDGNARYLLKLGDRFQMKTIVDQVEQFLIDSSDLPISTKLWLSEQYRLADLQKFCLDSFKTVKDIKIINDTEDYRNLSQEAKSALMDRVMQLD